MTQTISILDWETLQAHRQKTLECILQGPLMVSPQSQRTTTNLSVLQYIYVYVTSNPSPFKYVYIQEDVIRIIKAVKDGDEETLIQIFDTKKYDVNDIHDLAVSKLTDLYEIFTALVLLIYMFIN